MRHEPDSIESLPSCPEEYKIFRDVGWLEYFQRFKGSDETIAMEFARNLNDHQTQVRGLRIKVTKEVVSQVTTFLAEGRRWFNRKVNDPSLKEDFLVGEEKLEKK